MLDNQSRYMVMDETDAPYKKEEYSLSLSDKIDLLNIAKEEHLELDKNSDLYKLGKSLNII